MWSDMSYPRGYLSNCELQIKGLIVQKHVFGLLFFGKKVSESTPVRWSHCSQGLVPFAPLWLQGLLTLSPTSPKIKVGARKSTQALFQVILTMT